MTEHPQTELTLDTKPETTKATVRLFSGERLVLNVDRVWFFEGAPLRIWGTADGEHYKFKFDEEPFVLTFGEEPA